MTTTSQRSRKRPPRLGRSSSERGARPLPVELAADVSRRAGALGTNPRIGARVRRRPSHGVRPARPRSALRSGVGRRARPVSPRRPALRRRALATFPAHRALAPLEDISADVGAVSIDELERKLGCTLYVFADKVARVRRRPGRETHRRRVERGHPRPRSTRRNRTRNVGLAWVFGGRRARTRAPARGSEHRWVSAGVTRRLCGVRREWFQASDRAAGREPRPVERVESRDPNDVRPVENPTASNDAPDAEPVAAEPPRRPGGDPDRRQHSEPPPGWPGTGGGIGGTQF